MIYTQTDRNVHNNNPNNLQKVFSIDGALFATVSDFLKRVVLANIIFVEKGLTLNKQRDRLLRKEDVEGEGETGVDPGDSANHFGMDLDLEGMFQKFVDADPALEFDFPGFDEGLERGDFESGKIVLQHLNKLNIPSEFFTDLKNQLSKKRYYSNKFVLKRFPGNPRLSNKLVVFYLRERDSEAKVYSGEFIEVQINSKKRIVSSKNYKTFRNLVIEELRKRPEYARKIREAQDQVSIESVKEAADPPGVEETKDRRDVPSEKRKLISLFYADYKNYEWKNIEEQKQVCIKNGDEVGFSFEDLRRGDDNFQTDEFITAKLSADSGSFNYYEAFGWDKNSSQTEKEVAFKINIED